MSQNPTLSNGNQSPSLIRDATDGTDGSSWQGLHQALVALRSAQDTLRDQVPSAGGSPAETLDNVAEELALAQEELAAQLAEVETAASAVQEGRVLARRLLQSLPVPVVTTTRGGAILEANPAAEQLLQVPVQVLEQHKPVFAFVAATDRRTARDLLGAVVHQPSRTGLMTFTPRQGDAVTCNVVLTTWPAGEGSADGAVAGPDLVQWVVQPVGENASAAAHYRSVLMELSQLGVTDADLNDLLRRVADLAVRTVPGAHSASIVLGDPADPQTIVSTSPQAQAADGVQYMSGCGPIFDAYTGDLPVVTDHAADDPRWPDLGRAHEGGTAGAWLALPLEGPEKPIGVFMLYGESGLRFTERTFQEMEPFTAAAVTLVRDNHTLQEIRQVQQQLRDALSSRAVIDQAKGMIMLTRQCSAEEAFAVLVKMSNEGNRKIRELAAEFVEEATAGGRAPMR